MLLGLPTISAEVPRVIVEGQAGKRHLRLALAMSQARFIQQQDIAHLTPDHAISLTVFQQLIEAGWSRATSWLSEYKALAITAYLVIHPDSGMLSPYECVPDETEGIIVLDVGIHRNVVVGPTLMGLEEVHPGLGGTAMAILSGALAWESSPFTPAGAYEMASYLYWEGMEDESHLIADGEDGGSEEDESEIVTKQELFGGMPQWAYDPYACTPVPSKTLLALVEQNKDSVYRPLIEQLHKLKEAETKYIRYANRWRKHGGIMSPTYDSDHGCCEPLAALYWTTPTEDPIYRVFDDTFQLSMQAGDTRELGMIKFDLTKPGLVGALKRLHQLYQFFSVLDQTITMLEDYDEQQQSSLLINVFKG